MEAVANVPKLTEPLGPNATFQREAPPVVQLKPAVVVVTVPTAKALGAGQAGASLISISSMAMSLWLAEPRVATKRTIRVSAAGNVKAVSNHGGLKPAKGWLPLNTVVIADQPPFGVHTWKPKLPMEFPRA